MRSKFLTLIFFMGVYTLTLFFIDPLGVFDSTRSFRVPLGYFFGAIVIVLVCWLPAPIALAVKKTENPYVLSLWTLVIWLYAALLLWTKL